MSYQNSEIAKVAATLKKQVSKTGDAKAALRSDDLKQLFSKLSKLNSSDRASFGKELNQLKTELQGLGEAAAVAPRPPIDVTAPFDVNVNNLPSVLPSNHGSQHPLTSELETISDIFYRMGFDIERSRQIDDEFNMFEALNFPEGHPARDDYDTFTTKEGFVAPAHTSTMQNRMLKKYKKNLDEGRPIAVLIPDRVYRNEDLDATHEHTFYQIEGVYVDRGMNVGNLVATIRAYMSEFFGQELNVKIQPFYFPFTEPSFEFAVERPAMLRKGDGAGDQWLELGGCGMIHPNVLKMAGIDPKEFTGFAWGFGVERMVMMKHGIEDVRNFESGNLEFLRQFV